MKKAHRAKKDNKKVSKPQKLRDKCRAFDMANFDIWLENPDFADELDESKPHHDDVKRYWINKYGLQCPYRSKPVPKYYDKIETPIVPVEPIGKDENFGQVVHIYEDLPCKALNHKVDNCYNPNSGGVLRWPDSAMKELRGRLCKPRPDSSKASKAKKTSPSKVETMVDSFFQATLETDLQLSPGHRLQTRMVQEMERDLDKRIYQQQHKSADVEYSKKVYENQSQQWIQHEAEAKLESVVDRLFLKQRSAIFSESSLVGNELSDMSLPVPSYRPQSAPLAKTEVKQSFSDEYKNESKMKFMGIGRLRPQTAAPKIMPSNSTNSVGSTAVVSLTEEAFQDQSLNQQETQQQQPRIHQLLSSTRQQITESNKDSNSASQAKEPKSSDIENNSKSKGSSPIKFEDSNTPSSEKGVVPSSRPSFRTALKLPSVEVNTELSEVANEPEQSPSNTSRRLTRLSAILHQGVGITTAPNPRLLIRIDEHGTEATNTGSNTSRITGPPPTPMNTFRASNKLSDFIFSAREDLMSARAAADAGQGSPTSPLGAADAAIEAASAATAPSTTAAVAANAATTDNDDPLGDAVISRMSHIASAANMTVSSVAANSGTSVKGRRTLAFSDVVSNMTADKAEMRSKFMATVKKVKLTKQMLSNLDSKSESEKEQVNLINMAPTISTKLKINRAKRALNLEQDSFMYEKEFDQILETKRLKWQELVNLVHSLDVELPNDSITMGHLIARGKIMSIHDGILSNENDDADDDDHTVIIRKPVILKIARFSGNLADASKVFRYHHLESDEQAHQQHQQHLGDQQDPHHRDDSNPLSTPTRSSGTPLDSFRAEMYTDENGKSSSSASTAPSHTTRYPPEGIIDELIIEISSLVELGAHPNIRFLEGIVLRPLCLVLEKMEGILHDCLEDEQWQVQCSVKSRASILRQIISGLAYIHKYNYVHRDINPLNITYRQSAKGEFEVKIGDLQKAVKLATPETMLITPVGEMGYIAPEVYSPGHYNQISDIFSFGMVAWEIFAQRHRENPFRLHDPYAAVAKIEKNFRPHFGPEHPILIVDMATRCLATNPANRPSAASLELMFNDLLQSDENFYHIYDRSFAKEALDHMREHRQTANPSKVRGEHGARSGSIGSPFRSASPSRAPSAKTNSPPRAGK